MAKLTTRYDKELKEKVFVLRGEEAYARTTDCLLDEILHDPSESGIDPNTGRRIDWNNTIGYMLLEFRLDVLRDIGASYVVLYDNDEMLGVYDFDTNTHTIEFVYNENPDLDTRLKLAYGVEHNLWAKYMGNKHCLKSESKKYNFNEPVPSHFESSLSFDSLGLILPNTPITINVTLTATHGTDNQTIYLYDGNTLIGTATTVNGVATFTNITFTTVGKHTLTARYNGSDQLYSCSTNYDVSVGYRLTITNYPSYLISSNEGSVTVRAIDYVDRPVSGKDVYIANDVSDEPLSDEVTTNSDGVAVINNVSIESYPYYAKCNDGSNIYKSESVTTHIYNSVGITASANPTMISNGFQTTITGQVNQNVTQSSDGVPLDSPITLNVRAVDYNGDTILTDTVTTNATGGFNYQYTGASNGNSALVFGASDYVYTTVTIEDVIQYWKINGTSLNKSYNVLTGSLNELTQYYQLKPNYSSKCSVSISSRELYEGNWILSFIVKESNGINKLGFTSNGGTLEVDNPQLSKGSEVMCYLKDRTMGLFINGVEVKNISVTGKRTDRVYLDITCSSSLGFMGFDELKFIKDTIEKI